MMVASGDWFGFKIGDDVGVVGVDKKFVVPLAGEAKAVAGARDGGEVGDA